MRPGALKRLCQCIGWSSLVLLRNYVDLLGGGDNVRMHVPYRLTWICIAHIADILLLGIFLFAVVEILRKTGYAGWACLPAVLLVPPYIMERLPTPSQGQAWWTGGFVVLWIAVVLAFLFALPAIPALSHKKPAHEIRTRAGRVLRVLSSMGDTAGIFLAVFSALSIAQLIVVMAWRPGPQQIRAAWATGTQPPREHPKLVWILFDELSYNQVFEHRARDLSLPNFDALSRESTTYTQIQPIALRTAKAVPSLLSGAVVDDVRFSFGNSMSVHFDGTPGWRELTGAGTVFGDARKAGWRTAVVGWYNPYCTTYGDALDSCYWQNLDRLDGDMEPGAGLWRNVWTPLKQTAADMVWPGNAENCDVDVRERLKTYADLQQHGSSVLAADQADFVFLHMSTPHNPNIWSRAKQQYVSRCGSSYLDSLALSDRDLGRIMAVLKQSPRWKDTTVIVEGDHSWRVMLWNRWPTWTKEDERASGGRFDPRPALLIHRAGQTQGETDGRAMPLLYVHGVIEDVLRGRPGSQ